MVTEQEVDAIGQTLVDPQQPLQARFRALFTLRGLGGPGAISWISQAFSDDSALLKHELAYCLGQMQDVHAIPVLVDVLRDTRQEPMVRHEAAKKILWGSSQSRGVGCGSKPTQRHPTTTTTHRVEGPHRVYPFIRGGTPGHFHLWALVNSSAVNTGEALGAIGKLEVLEILKQYSTDPVVEVAETCQLAVRRLEWLQQHGGEPAVVGPYLSVDPAPPAEEQDVGRLREALLDEARPLFDRYRAMFALRNTGGKEAALALAEGVPRLTGDGQPSLTWAEGGGLQGPRGCREGDAGERGVGLSSQKTQCRFVFSDS
ncbi:deoxyhypusine hydroxylase isoform X3 [Loxodonta africana]|uniref:deoxyhypusine hydroxylase isoform X3 n=1 Tax=Loxodonta africana TaxID=9785 RepID=UPI000C811586|nr:deoxyhypusine hydroxylase isoform X1 [Loxodonta africana]XP_023396707.1 deoxyhypusine hydroxylase isoform X1 [Loxodonta africana]